MLTFYFIYFRNPRRDFCENCRHQSAPYLCKDDETPIYLNGILSFFRHDSFHTHLTVVVCTVLKNEIDQLKPVQHYC